MDSLLLTTNCRTGEAGAAEYHVHELEKPKLTPRVVEEQIDVGVVASIVARHRAKKIEVDDAETLRFGLVLLQPGNGRCAIHAQP